MWFINFEKLKDKNRQLLIKAGGRTISSEIHTWESIVTSIYKEGDKTDRSYYRGISLLSVMYTILSKSFCQV
jgi:hypothetical protein